MNQTNARLFIITGTSGTGKSTLVPILKDKLSKNYAVYDWDEILRPYDGTEEVWAHEVAEKMFQITKENTQKNISTVILGLVRPVWIKKYQNKYGVENIHFCLLDISVEEREKRLKNRGATDELIQDLEELHGLPNWIKENGFDYFVIDTSYDNPLKIANRIMNWIN